ncbi:DUF4192 family protein [Humibacillus xanthopallidus]|uniref:Uncharacterized protein DUF4192 n=1 Tax=Humibacillus xanthopallidus TaxID=412689 RepID=A0A543HJE3_9MICO|nr:DUF4192 family protein [Humibacillus xanthopallidus]TQM58458.1 uncharacterized protein DUF4192 [Humibacillus xanthopallidus]
MPKISLSGPADLLTILPFHLGFQPTRSVVVVCFHGKRIGLVARFDIAPDHLAADAAAAGLPTLVRDRPSSVCLVGFEEEPGESDALSAALRAGLEQERVVVQDRLVVRNGRWFTVDCDCCPPGGRPMPQPADVPAVAGYIALGHSVLEDRDSLAGLVQPLAVDDPRHDDVEAAIDIWQARYTVSVAIDRIRAGTLPVDGDLGDLDRLRELERLAADLDDLTADLTDELGEDLAAFEDEDDDDDGLGHLGDFGDFGDLGEVGDNADGAVVIDLETGRRRAASWGSADVDDDVDDEDDDAGAGVSPVSVLLQAESLAAWSEVLHGEVGGERLVERVPALVGPLRDVVFRDALIAWLCPGAVPLSDFPPGLVALFEALVGTDVRSAAAAESVPPQPRPRRGRRKRGRRLERRLDRHRGRPDDIRIEGRIDGHGSAWEDWRAWEEASAPHHVHARLESVCRVVPAPHAAPLLAVVGNYAWWRGDGARAGVAIDAALDLEPDHRLAGLLRDALDHGLRGRGADNAPVDDLAAHGPSGSWNSPSSA